MGVLEAKKHELTILGKIRSHFTVCFVLIIPKLPVLTRDIRKVPKASPKAPRKASLISNSPKKTSTVSDLDQTGSSTAVATGESSVTSVPTTPIESRDFNGGLQIKKHKLKFHQKPLLTNQPEQRYWNEYDNPEDASGDENGYYIYVDPNASEKFMGQETIEKLYAKLKAMFRNNKNQAPEDEECRPILSPHLDDEVDSSPTDSDNDSPKVRWPKNYSYGTVPRDAAQNNGPDRRFSTYKALFDPTSSRAVAAPLSSYRLLLATMTMSSSAVICIIITTLAATGRKRQRGEVDAVVLFGVIMSLFFALVGMVSVLTSRQQMSLIKWILFSALFIVVCVADGALVGWVV
jgi:hypothetical protein